MREGIVTIFCTSALGALLLQAHGPESTADQPAPLSKSTPHPVAENKVDERLTHLLRILEQEVAANRQLRKKVAPDPYPCDLIAR